MSVEQAFLKAVQTNPRSKLVVRIKKAIKRGRNGTADAPECPAHVRERERYGWNQLGRKWASLKLAGCAWVASIEDLRREWRELHSEAGWQQGPEGRVELLLQLAAGMGLSKDRLDARGRDYLMWLVASRPPEDLQLYRIDGARWFSPLSILVDSIDDLADHSPVERKAMRDFLSNRIASEQSPTESTSLRRLCRPLAEWFEADQPLSRLATPSLDRPGAAGL